MVEKGPKLQGAFKNPEAILDVFLKIEHTTYNSQLDPDLMKSWAFDVARVFRLRASAPGWESCKERNSNYVWDSGKMIGPK